VEGKLDPRNENEPSKAITWNGNVDKRANESKFVENRKRQGESPGKKFFFKKY